MGNRRDVSALGRRERQIMEAVFRLGEASVGDVLGELPDPPAYDSVRTMLRMLESKGFVKHRRVGNKYVYRPAQSRAVASRSAVRNLMQTFFDNSVADTMAAAIDAGGKLTDAELARIEELIANARKEGR